MIYSLEDRSLLKVSGEEAPGFLQGLITNDVELVKEGAPLYASLLTPQGKYLFDFIVFKKGQDYYIDCESLRLEDLIKKLKLYKLRSKVTLENLTGYYGSVYLDETLENQDHILVSGQDPRHPALGVRIWSSQGVETKPFEGYRKRYLQHLIPYGSVDLEVDRSVILEYGFDALHGLSWTKGCYVGQELMARTHHRGLVRKGLFLSRLESGTVHLGDELSYNGEKVGVARCPVTLEGKVYALVLLRRDLVASFNPAMDRLISPEGSLSILSDPETI